MGPKGTSPGKARASVDQREKRAKAVPHQSAVLSFREVNVTKEVCFWFPGQDNPAQIPKEPSVKGPVDRVCFFRASTELCNFNPPLKCPYYAFSKIFPLMQCVMQSDRLSIELPAKSQL